MSKHTEIDFSSKIVAGVDEYIFHSEEEATQSAKALGLVTDDGVPQVHSLQYEGGIAFMPGRNSREFFQWYWDAFSTDAEAMKPDVGLLSM